MSHLSICSSTASSAKCSVHQEHPQAGGVQLQPPVPQLLLGEHSHGGLEAFPAEPLHRPALPAHRRLVQLDREQELTAQLVAHVQPQAARCAMVHAGEVDLDKHEVGARDERRQQALVLLEVKVGSH